jgi:hypothetical protein
MADVLLELLTSPTAAGTTSPAPGTLAGTDAVTLGYLQTLASRPLTSLATTEPQALAQSSHSLLLSLQALSKKSHRAIVESADRHAALHSGLPALVTSTAELRKAISTLDGEAIRFSTTYNKSSDHELLGRRKQALLLSRNVERVVDVLELPTLLSSAVSAIPANYASALDLNGHIRRLHSLYPRSALVSGISVQADEAMRSLAASLVLSLKAPGLKLAASLRAMSWLRRVLPDLEAGAYGPSGTTQAREQDSQEHVLGPLFLVCRLATLLNMLDALEPLRALADQEKARQRSIGSGNAWSGGQQTERYLKRYIEIFREQSFTIVSMYRSIFPSRSSPHGHDTDRSSPDASQAPSDPLEPLPSSLATFPLYLIDTLLETLRLYFPTVKDQASRDSLLTQVMYCAGSLGRLGGDFGMFLADLDIGVEAEEEWVEIVKRHRLLAGRLESLVGDYKGKPAGKDLS